MKDVATRVLSRQTARRYILGRQGLWPGRRGMGKAGTAQAIRQSECVQIDTINVIARSHDTTLWSRVWDYTPALLDELVYEEREFFDYGAILMLYPVEEWDCWQTVMRQMHDRLNHAHVAEATAHVRAELQARGPLGNRDFAGRERIPGGFRTIKDTGKALQYLYLSGQVMTHTRRRFERIYDFTDRVRAQCPPERMQANPENGSDRDDAETFFARKALRDCGLASPAEWARRVTAYRRAHPKTPRHTLNALAEVGLAGRAQIADTTETRYFPLEDAALLDALEAGEMPAAWNPLDVTTGEEVTLLAPLDNVIWDRARLKALFDFDYIWEVYKPAHLRRWGYYTLPILWGDRLAARIALRLNRKSGVLHCEGVWLERDDLRDNPAFVSALRAGLSRFAAFHDAEVGAYTV